MHFILKPPASTIAAPNSISTCQFWQAYGKQMPSLPEVVLVVSEYARVEGYRRAQGDQWTIETYDGLDASAWLESIACHIPLRRIYHKVSWLD